VVEVEPREDAGRLSEAFRFRDLPKRGMAGRVERSESSKALCVLSLAIKGLQRWRKSDIEREETIVRRESPTGRRQSN
jgi:hypothetical protein